MRLINRYYEKIYKQTERITKKLFKKDVTGTLALRHKIKQHIEKITGKKIDNITDEEITKYHLGYYWAKYKTLSKILEVIETACTLKTFTIEEYENEC